MSLTGNLIMDPLYLDRLRKFKRSVITMTFEQEIKNLESIHKEGTDKIYSMYLNTDPSDPDQQGGKWKIQLKKSLQNFTNLLKEDDNKEELENFKIVKDKVERYMEAVEQDLARGVILFASVDDVWFAKKVQMRLKSEFDWEAEPNLQQLKKLEIEFPKTGIILVQQNLVKVIDAHLNIIRDVHNYELNLDTEDWTVKKGPGRGGGEVNYQEDKYENKVSAHQQRWYKSIAPKLDKLTKDKEWEEIYLLGEREAVNELDKQMNKEITFIVNKNMLHHEESEVLKELSK